jgi:hypothetical protein
MQCSPVVDPPLYTLTLFMLSVLAQALSLLTIEPETIEQVFGCEAFARYLRSIGCYCSLSR